MRRILLQPFENRPVIFDKPNLIISRGLSGLFILLPLFSVAQFVHLEEFVILEKYCPGEKSAVVRVLDQDNDDEFEYRWQHNGSGAETIIIDAEDFGREFCVERLCPCGTVYESCFVFDPEDLKKGRTILEKEDISCHGMNDGSVSVMASGPGPFRYHWSTGAATAGISGLTAGRYQVSVTDALGCEQILKTKIKEPRKLRLRPQLLAKNKTYSAVKLKISGGTPGYFLNGEKASKKFLFSTKKMKRYEFEVEDARGCVSQATIVLRKKFKKKKARAVLAKMPKKRKKGKCKLRCPKI